MPRWLRELCRNIRRRMNIVKGGDTVGIPDIVAWQPNHTDPLFIEYKGLKDKTRPAQEEWVRAALLEDSGLESSIAFAQRVRR